MSRKAAAEIVADAMLGVPHEERSRYLREMLAHVAAGLVVVDGSRAAAEACYRLSDAVVSRIKQ